MVSHPTSELMADKLADAKHAINEGIAHHHSKGPIDMAVLRGQV